MDDCQTTVLLVINKRYTPNNCLSKNKKLKVVKIIKEQGGSQDVTMSVLCLLLWVHFTVSVYC